MRNQAQDSQPSTQDKLCGMRSGADSNVLTVRRGKVEWVMEGGHISGAGHAISAVSWHTRRHPPSRKSQSHLHIGQNTCVERDWCGWRSVYTDHQHRENSVKDKVRKEREKRDRKISTPCNCLMSKTCSVRIYLIRA